MKKISKQPGFAVLEIILIFVILGTISFTGWFVWHSKQNADKNYNSSSSSSQEKAKPAAKSTAKKQTPAPPPQQYLVIKEWGVKIPLSADITGAYYTIKSSPPEDIVYLLDTGFDNTSNANGVKCKDTYTAMYAIARVHTADIGQIGDEEGEHAAFLAGGVSTVMPGYYVSGTKANQSLPQCSYLNVTTDTEDQNINTVWAAKKTAFNTAYGQLQVQ